MTLMTPTCLDYFSPGGGSLVVSDVVLDRIESAQGIAGTAIASTGHLAGSRLRVVTHDYFFDFSVPGARFLGGLACVSDPFFEGLKGHLGGEGGPGEPGGYGIEVSDTELYLAGVSGKGGEGAEAVVFGLYCDLMWPAERGGPGLFLEEDSMALLAARPTVPMFLEGGLGGYGGPLSGCGNPSFPGGQGGDAIHAENGSMVLLSGPFDLRPGQGGQGSPDGPPGEKIVGDVINVPVEEWAPILGISGTGAIASVVTVDLEAEPDRQVLLVLSDRFDRIHLPRAGGFPLFAVPGGNLFLVASVGRTRLDGTLDVSIPIPDEFDLVGYQLLIQAIVMPESGDQLAKLSNVVCEVFRDKE
jgi:hypothetical protein